MKKIFDLQNGSKVYFVEGYQITEGKINGKRIINKERISLNYNNPFASWMDFTIDYSDDQIGYIINNQKYFIYDFGIMFPNYDDAFIFLILKIKYNKKHTLLNV